MQGLELLYSATAWIYRFQCEVMSSTYIIVKGEKIEKGTDPNVCRHELLTFYLQEIQKNADGTR